MSRIHPVSDLRNHFAEITREVQKSPEPVFRSKNGGGFLVVMSKESYGSMVYDKLREAELQASSTKERVSHENVMAKARERIRAAEEPELTLTLQIQPEKNSPKISANKKGGPATARLTAIS